MSHIAEVYAKDLGVKIGNLKLTEHFYPIVQEKYVCFEIESNEPCYKYDYWEIVFSMLNPILQKEKISIFQMPKILNKQKNYFIKNSLLYFGLSSHYVNIADSYGVPSVSLLPNIYKNNLNSFNHAVVLTPDFSDIKPSFSTQENPKRINDIKPEIVAQKVLDQLNIEEKINFKTVRAGSNFQNEIVELIPDFDGLATELEGKPINIRGDLHFNLERIINWCRYSIVNLYLTEVLSKDQLNSMNNLKQIIFKYNKSHKKTNLNEFFKNLKEKKVNIIISCANEELLSDARLEYFDYTVISDPKPDKKIKASKFISKKKFISNKEVYNSESSAKRLDKSNNFVYDDFSSKELEYLYLYDE
jgi:ADP-heptose:LPS heptosyltransferase